MARGKGIYRRGKIYWIRYSDSEGRMHFESSGSEAYYVASDLLLTRRTEVKDGKLPQKYQQHITFFTLTDEYEKVITHQRSYKNKITMIKHLKEHFGNIKLKDFNTRDIESFQTKLLTIDNRKPATVNRHIATLHHMFTKAYQWEMISEEVAKKAKLVKLYRENNQRLRYLTIEECKLLLDSCSDDIKPIVIIGLNTGLRKATILNLKYKNIDFINNTITITNTKNNYRLDLPMNELVKQTILNIPRLEGQEFIFVRKGGTVYKNIDQAFINACKKANLNDVVFHTLRHSFGSILAMKGTDILTIKELMGHKSLRMTMRYLHLFPSQKTNAVNILSNTLNF